MRSLMHRCAPGSRQLPLTGPAARLYLPQGEICRNAFAKSQIGRARASNDYPRGNCYDSRSVRYWACSCTGLPATLQITEENPMPKYPIHTIASAPENSKPALERLQQAFGILPNLAAAIANSPKLINSLVGVFQQVHSSSLTEPEIQVVLLTDAVANSSMYAVAFHTALALQQGVGSEETGAIRERRAPANERFAALSNLAKTLIEKRGCLSEQELDSF